MKEHSEHVESRLKKLRDLREAGVEPFAGAFDFENTALVAEFEIVQPSTSIQGLCPGVPVLGLPSLLGLDGPPQR